MLKPTPPVLAVLALLAAASDAEALDVHDLDIFVPNTLDDAFVGEPGEAQLQGAGRYDRRRGHDELRLFPQLQVIPLRGLQLSFNVPYTFRSGPEPDESAIGVGALYVLNDEKHVLPAFALSADYNAAIGPGDRGSELELAGIASKTLEPTMQRRLHLNVAWIRRFDPSEEERRNSYRFAAGYSQLLSPNTVVIADYVRERQERGERDANVLELGFRHRAMERVTLGIGAGAGIGHDSPRFRALFSIQVSLPGS